MFTRRSFPSTAAIHMFLAGCLFLQGSPSFAAGQGGSDRGGEVKTPPGRQCIPNPRKLKLPSPPFCPAAPVGAVTGPFCPLGSCPPPPPPLNATVDTNSAQTIYGQKSFMQPLQGTLDGVAMYADQFLGSLTGDVAGPQWATQVVNVSAGALPSIGFGPGAGPRVKHVFADADPADPRADGSIAHPFASLAQAARGAQYGDRFILSGILNETIVFPAAVSIEGAGSSLTTLNGTLEFAGFGDSRVADLSVNCVSSQPCITNHSMTRGTLEVERVTVTQSSQKGTAVASASGPVIVRDSAINNLGAGVGVSLAQDGLEESFLTDSTVSVALNGAVVIVGGRLSVRGVTLVSDGANPAVLLSGVDRMRANELTAASKGVTVVFNNLRQALVFGSTFTSGIGKPAVGIMNAPPPAATPARDPSLLFVDNIFAGDLADPFQCDLPTAILAAGNFVPLHPEGAPLSTGGCLRTSFVGF